MINTTEAARFLHFLSGEFVWQTFDDSKKNPQLARVLTGSLETNLAKLNFIQEKGGGVCIQINEGTLRGAKHITAIRAVFVDLDGEPLDRIKNAVKGGFCKPHCVVETSPGRYHVYWIPLLCTVQQFGIVQRALADKFGGDQSVHNLDRVMRVPGTWHLKGQPFQCRILHLKPDSPLLDITTLWGAKSVFTNPIPQHLQGVGSLNEALVTTNVEPKTLPAGNRTQYLIQLAGRLVVKCPEWGPDQILAKLKEVALAKLPEGDQPKSEQSWQTEIMPGIRRFCATRDSERAKAEAQQLDEKLALESSYDALAAPFNEMLDDKPLTFAEFCNRFVYVSSDRLVFDLTKSPRAAPWSLVAFKDWAGVYKEGDKLFVTRWLKNAQYRKTVHTVTYVPYPHSTDQDKLKVSRIVREPLTGELAYNIYSPPTLQPAGVLELPKVQVFLEHIEYLYQNEAERKLFLDWMAATVQNPARRVSWAPLIITTHQGVGKGALAQVLQKIVGAANYQMIRQEQLEPGSAFNDFLYGSTVVVVDELKARRRTDIVNKLNAMVTETTMEVNRKFGEKRTERIYANFICFSNHVDCLAIDQYDRRYWINLFEDEPKPYAYYSRFFNWMDSDGPAHVLRWLLERDISKFGWGERPPTSSAKQAVIEGNWTQTEACIKDAIKDKEGPFEFDIVSIECVYEYVAQESTTPLDKGEKYEIQRVLKSLGTAIGKFNVVGSKRQTAYAIRRAKFWQVQSRLRVENELSRACQSVGLKKKLKSVR